MMFWMINMLRINMEKLDPSSKYKVIYGLVRERQNNPTYSCLREYCSISSSSFFLSIAINSSHCKRRCRILSIRIAVILGYVSNSLWLSKQGRQGVGRKIDFLYSKLNRTPIFIYFWD